MDTSCIVLCIVLCRVCFVLAADVCMQCQCCLHACIGVVIHVMYMLLRCMLGYNFVHCFSQTKVCRDGDCSQSAEVVNKMVFDVNLAFI